MEKTRDMCVTLAASPAHTCTIALKDGAVTTTTLRGKGLPVQTRIDFSKRPEKAAVRAFLNQVKDTLSDGKFAVVSSVGVVEEDAREAGVIAMLRRHKLQFAPAVADPSDLPAGAAAPPPPETARPWTLFLRKVSAVLKEAAKSGVDAAVRSVATDGKTISQFASSLRKLKSTDEWTDADILAALPSFLLSRASETPTAVDSAKSEVEHEGDGDEGKSSESSEGEEDPGQADPSQADPGQADTEKKEKKPEESGEDAGNQTSSTRAALSAAQASCAQLLALQAAARDAEQDSERALDLARGKDVQTAAAVVAARERLDQALLEAKATKDARAQARASYESRKRDSSALAEQVCAAQAILFAAEKALADAEAAAAEAAPDRADRADRAKGGAEGAKASPGSGAGAGAGGAGGAGGGGGSGSVPTHERRKHIPKHVKTLVWNKYVGEEAAVATCTCCRAAQISVRSFHCGHVIAEAAGGGVTLNNLRPICAACNGSMGVRSMNEFTSEFFGWVL